MKNEFERFVAALQAGAVLQPLAGLALADAYRIAAQRHALRLAAGERPVGRKIGHTNPVNWAAQGINAPSWGWLYAGSTRPLAGARPLPAWREPRLELECVLRLARTPDSRADLSELADCVDAMALGLEIVDRPYPSWQIGVADSVAANGVHAALWLGPWQPLRAEALGRLQACLRLGEAGSEGMSEGGSALVLGSPLVALARLMRLLDEQGAPPLVAGEIVTTGALAPALPLQGGAMHAEIAQLAADGRREPLLCWPSA